MISQVLKGIYQNPLVQLNNFWIYILLGLNTKIMFTELKRELTSSQTTLVAVSKTKSEAQILELYHQGHRHFGENRVQELCRKHENLPKDINWHLIGHLQTNKVKYVVPFVHMIHSVDSIKVLKEINKQAGKVDRRIKCLLQFRIAEEDSKFGFEAGTISDFFEQNPPSALSNIEFCGVMGMATFTDNRDQVRDEFRRLRAIFLDLNRNYFTDEPSFSEISMGMSGDYKIAIEEGSTLVRIGRMLFGERTYAQQVALST